MAQIRPLICNCGIVPPKSRWLLPVMVSVALFAVFELWVGVMSHSLTLRADSGHMFGDVSALAIALCATGLARRASATAKGGHRFELMAALVNGLGLMAMALWIGREALHHLQGPPTEILSWPMLVTALLGLLINGVNLYWLHGHIHQDLNLRGAFLHIVADLLGSLGAIAAALAVTYLGWMWADTLIGVGVALLVAGSALPLLWQSWQQLRHPPLPPQSLEAMGWCEVGQTQLSHLLKTP
ncbi:cation diffusion facilitator family transporter [Leptolyngbya sp. PCC 6406]|uniref:cation diffusion facilitator family transporter n=1 Tax=Leptolyngbya sp. PCC 6406 TaxID=1173264 RepID=UPI0002AC9183|nr:cation diffusion facilitator family transporter [Leptolyngbya sp. PCC 6406]